MLITKLIFNAIKRETKKLVNKDTNYITDISYTDTGKSNLVIKVKGYPGDIETTMILAITLTPGYNNIEDQILVPYSVNSAFFGEGVLQYINGNFVKFDLDRITSLIDYAFTKSQDNR